MSDAEKFRTILAYLFEFALSDKIYLEEYLVLDICFEAE